jgi:predicted dehydrogenase
VQSVRAFVVQNNPQIPPADTLAAALHFENGAVGSYVASYADTPNVVSPLLIVGSDAILRVGRGYVEIERGGEVERRETPRVDGVKNELAAFIAAVRGGEAHINTPEEALRDVAIIEALLTSGASERAQRVARI